MSDFNAGFSFLLSMRIRVDRRLRNNVAHVGGRETATKNMARSRFDRLGVDRAATFSAKLNVDV